MLAPGLCDAVVPDFRDSMVPHLIDDLARVSCQTSEERPVAVHDDEAKLGVAVQQLGEGFCVEFVVAQVQGLAWWRMSGGGTQVGAVTAQQAHSVDGLERLKVEVDLLLLAFVL